MSDDKPKFELIQGKDEKPIDRVEPAKGYRMAHIEHMGQLTDETNPQLIALGKAIRIRNTSKETKTLLEIINKAANLLETRGYRKEADEIRAAAVQARSLK